jgi:predicted nucleic acid-binding protein
MVIIADTSPLNYLVLIDAIELLPGLYGRIPIPEAVSGELARPGTPDRVAEWARLPKAWVTVARPPSDDSLRDFGEGEREVLALAEQHKPDVLVLIDDAKARLEARRRGIRTSGTLGVLLEASRIGLIDLPDSLIRLQNTNFRISRKLLDAVLRK